MTKIPRLVSRRWASRQMGIPGDEILTLFEERGWEVYRFGNRVRLREEDVVALLAEARTPPRQAVRDRLKLIKELAEREVLGR